MKKRIFKAIKWILTTVLTLLIILFISNEIVYRTLIPNDFSESNWSGKWNSSDYALISGKVLTKIPNNYNKEFKSKTLIYYNLWSLYKPGQIKIVELSGNFSTTRINGNNLNQKREPNKPSKSKLRLFKAKIDIGNGQVIEYSGIKDSNEIQINGNYNSNSPSDKGTFKLNKKIKP